MWIEGARVERIASGYRVHLSLSQDEPTYVLRVPISLTTEGGTEYHPLALAARRQEFVIDVGSKPRSLTLDPEFRLFRSLDPGEAPPILRQVMLDPATVTILAGPDAAVRATAADLARRLLDHPPRMDSSGSPPDKTPLLVIGLLPDVDEFLSRAGLPPRPASLLGKGTAQVWSGYQRNGRAMTVVSGDSPEALRDLLRPLPHYGRQSYVVFDGATALERGVWPAQPPEWRFSEHLSPGATGR